MKRALINKFGLIIIMLLSLAPGCSTKDEHADEESGKYTCPMHPQIVSDEPGTCPICKMDLVPVSGHGQMSANDSLKHLVKPTDELVQSSLKTVKPQSGKRFAADIVRGVINYNTNNWKSISSRVGGRIERLYVKYNYQPVNKGQKIMDIYSPDLANAQQELLFLKQNNEPELLEAAKRKLRLLGISDQQIAATLRSGKVDYTISVYSPYSGYLVEGAQPAASTAGASAAGATMISGGDDAGAAASMGGSSMGASASPANSAVPAINTTNAISVKEGQYVAAGQKLFDLINATSVWAEFFLRPGQLDRIKRGTEVEISSADEPLQVSKTKVSLVQPYYNEGSNFTIARASLNNPGKAWRVGQLINVSTNLQEVSGNWVPRKAVLQLGGRQVLFVKQQGGFRPVYIRVLNTMGDWVDIGKSVSADTEIAVNAWFLVDSESFVKPDSIKP